MIDGRAYLEVTDFDFVVTTPGTNGERVIHLEELKTGKNDSHGAAAAQINDGRTAFVDAVAGGDPVKLLEGSKGSTKDVTGTFDLPTFGSADTRARGPEKAENPFDKNLGIDAKSLESAIERPLEDWHPKPPQGGES
jgi:hypothetical protein